MRNEGDTQGSQGDKRLPDFQVTKGALIVYVEKVLAIEKALGVSGGKKIKNPIEDILSDLIFKIRFLFL